MTGLIFNTLSLLLEFIELYITIRGVQESDFRPRKVDLISSILIVTIMSITSFYFDPLMWSMGLILYLLYCITYTDLRLINRFFLYCFSYTTVVLVQLCLFFVLTYCRIYYNHEIMSIIANLLTIAILLIIFRFFPFSKVYAQLSVSALIYRLLFINTYFVVAGILFCQKLHTNSFYSNLIYFVIMVIVLITANTCMLYYDQKLYAKQQQLLSYQKNLPIYQSLIEEIRASQHEFTNRIQTLAQLPLTCPDYSSICQALTHATASYMTPLRSYPLLQINMPLLAASLYNLQQKAACRNISFLLDIGTTCLKSNAPEYIITDFISILTNNAMEECVPGDSIYIRMSDKENRLCFEIRNPLHHALTAKDLNMIFSKNYTSKAARKKEDGLPHGLGLYTLSNQIRNYNGSISVECAEFEKVQWIVFELVI